MRARNRAREDRCMELLTNVVTVTVESRVLHFGQERLAEPIVGRADCDFAVESSRVSSR